MKLSRIPLFLVSLSILVLNGCGFYKVCDLVPLYLPAGGLGELQGSPPLFWNISWLDSDGLVGTRQVGEGDYFFVQIPREKPVIVTASPITPHIPGPFQLKSAGFVSAADNPRPLEILMTWERGFAADFLLNLAESGFAPEQINIRKFLEATELRLGDSPWCLDLARLSTELLKGDLWTYSFRNSEFFDVILPLQPGLWYSEYPPDKPIYSENGVWSGELAVGLHNFVRPSDGAIISVSINERGELTRFQ